MELGIRSLVFLVLIFTFLLLTLDIHKNINMKQELFENVRMANQDSLNEILEKYERNEVIEESEMLERWLINFINNHHLSTTDLKISFKAISASPPLYLVSVEGYADEYAIVLKDAYVRYQSGTTIVTNN